MDFFLINKNQPVEENVIFTSKKLFELLKNEMHIDELFERFSKDQGITLNLNVERILYLSLTFLFSFDLISLKNNLVKRIDNDT
ncbi:ABC-three component system middle component 6 [Gracilibacillus sp. YIM 98692]|uniref:ABC-three component system middle component 6 n=1 Tax=Gracilibacillus sp. YIM 98692 TaxID=2663532 RepID=UPI0013D88E47